MGDNTTKHSLRAAAGQSKAFRSEVVRPDTLIAGPDGKALVLGRKPDAAASAPRFHKFNPGRRGAGAAKFTKAAAAAAAARRSGPESLPGRIPFAHMILTAVIVHRVWTFLSRRLLRKPDAKAGAGSKQLARRRGEGGADGEEDEEDEDEDEEEELDERAEELLSQMQGASMLPTMLRSSLPRPKHANAARRAAQQHHSRPRTYRTAHQMMHPGGAAGAAPAKPGAAGAGEGAAGRRPVAQRPLGKLEKMDLLVRQQVRAAMLAQAQQHHQMMQQQGLLGPGAGAAPHPALPGPSGSAAGAAGPSSTAGGASTGTGPSGSSGPLALAPRPLPAGAIPPPPPLAPPAFRPLPPDLMARLAGMPRPGAAAAAPSARRAAAAASVPEQLQAQQQQQQQQQQQAGASASGSGSAAAEHGAGSSGAGPSTSGGGAAVSGGAGGGPGALAAGQQGAPLDVSALVGENNTAAAAPPAVARVGRAALKRR
ncbi:hypothetical protein HXX76_008751 [Chlamydomonas incerta]|uniref:Uncharacterized protein n=1 Tax=Chlamydomonas incerta TaxID=51695 RepID=A0A835T380_CHLIN|nr:hypothetical protein HXX76_008751 [Chlamydomonas incerta]|eukprot:KAG2433024.1 hypothetical protein HXX76_008751 [Chlamydomonas incerta]